MSRHPIENNTQTSLRHWSTKNLKIIWRPKRLVGANKPIGWIAPRTVKRMLWKPASTRRVCSRDPFVGYGISSAASSRCSLKFTFSVTLPRTGVQFIERKPLYAFCVTGRFCHWVSCHSYRAIVATDFRKMMGIARETHGSALCGKPRHWVLLVQTCIERLLPVQEWIGPTYRI